VNEQVNDTIHATGIVLDGAGILIRGPSGAGKSLLALELIARWTARDGEALLVADDRVALAVEDGALLMTAPASIAGRIELRGRGIITRPYRQKARLHLVVDLVTMLERMPEEAEFTTMLAGVTLPRCPVPNRGTTDSGHQMLLIEAALAALAGSGLPQGQKSA
jgi:serine kinase of HPr protein (carbohydrate metabolism regulator)